MNIHETFDLPGKNKKVQKEIEEIEEKALDEYGVYLELANKIEEINSEIKSITSLIKEKIEKIDEIDKLIYSNGRDDIDPDFSVKENTRLKSDKIKLESEINHLQEQKEKLIFEKNSLISSN